MLFTYKRKCKKFVLIYKLHQFLIYTIYKKINMNKKKRIIFIDLAKGFCILLVLLSHTLGDLSNSWLLLCGYFRMPLYFFLSGLFFKKYDSFIYFIRKKATKLLIPFLLFYIFISVPSILFTYHIENHSFYGIVPTFFEKYGTLNLGINGAIWFLLCLFEINILFYLLTILFRDNAKYIIASSLIIGIIGYMLNYYNIFIYLWLDTAFTALPYFGFGWILNRKKKLLYGSFSKMDFLFLMLCFIVLLLLKCNHSERYIISYGSNIYDESLLSLYFGGFIGTFFIILISKALNRLPIISYIGRYSIVILTTHLIYLFLIRNILFKFGVDQNSILINAIVFLVIILLSFPTIYYGVRYLPLFFAQDKK